MKLLCLLSLIALAACGGPSSSTPPKAPHPDTDTVKKETMHLPPPDQQDTLRNGHEVIRRPGGGKLMEGDKLDGKRNGVWTSYNEDGHVKSRNDYVDGVLQGQAIVFRENGALYYQGQHRNGKQVGEWKFYDEQGNLAKTVRYDTAGNVVPGH